MMRFTRRRPLLLGLAMLSMLCGLQRPAAALIEVEIVSKARAKELGITVLSVPHLIERNAREVFFERGEFERVIRELRAPLRPPMWMAYFTGWRVASEMYHSATSRMPFG